MRERKRERERERVHKQGQGRERGRPWIWSRLQALSCQHRARCEVWTHRPQDHDLRCSRPPNWLSYPGQAPPDILSSNRGSSFSAHFHFTEAGDYLTQTAISLKSSDILIYYQVYAWTHSSGSELTAETLNFTHVRKSLSYRKQKKNIQKLRTI